MRLHRVPGTACLLSLFLLPSCGMFGGSDGGLESVDGLVGAVERVYVESELARQEARASVERLQALVAQEYGEDPIAAFQTYRESVTRSFRQAKKLEESTWSMRRAAQPVFDKWTADLAKFHNPDMRRRSQERLDEIRGKCDAIVRGIGPLMSVYTKLNQGLKDHELFLANDFNKGSVTAVQTDVDAIVDLADEIDSHFAECLRAAKDYLDTSAMPANESHVAEPPSAPPAAPPAGK